MISMWESPSAVCVLSVGEIKNAEPDFPSWSVENTADIKPHMDPTLSQMQREDIQKALVEYMAARGTAAGRPDRATMRIETGPALPSSSPPYRFAHSRKPIVQEEFKEMLHDGITQPSHSPWATPMLLVPKKNGTLRICIDYRKLIEVTRPDPFPIPKIDDLLDWMSSAKFITTFNLARGYWQVPIDPASREKTTFSMDFEKYEFRVMPFGLVGAPATFQRLMMDICMERWVPTWTIWPFTRRLGKTTSFISGRPWRDWQRLASRSSLKNASLGWHPVITWDIGSIMEDYNQTKQKCQPSRLSKYQRGKRTWEPSSAWQAIRGISCLIM